MRDEPREKEGAPAMLRVTPEGWFSYDFTVFSAFP